VAEGQDRAGLMGRFSRLEFGDSKPSGTARADQLLSDADHFLQEARRYWLAGDFEVALRNFCRALEQDRTRIEGWSGQVLMLIELGEYKEADLWAAKALELFPEHPDLLGLRAIALARDARPRHAIQYSDKAVAVERPTAWAWLARAEIFKQKADAIVLGCISKAIAAAGNDLTTVKLQAGRILRERRAYPEAISYLTDVVSAIPTAGLAWFELGCCQQAIGLPQAKASLEQALRINPQFVPAKRAINRLEKGRLFF